MGKLLLLHGAIGSSVAAGTFSRQIKEFFYGIHLLNFSGHAGKEIPKEPFSIEMFAADVTLFYR